MSRRTQPVVITVICDGWNACREAVLDALDGGAE